MHSYIPPCAHLIIGGDPICGLNDEGPRQPISMVAAGVVVPAGRTRAERQIEAAVWGVAKTAAELWFGCSEVATVAALPDGRGAGGGAECGPMHPRAGFNSAVRSPEVCAGGVGDGEAVCEVLARHDGALLDVSDAVVLRQWRCNQVSGS